MALTASGIGSGLDISGIVNQLMTLEARPLRLLDAREASFQARLSGIGQLKSALAPMQSALNSLKTPSSFQGMRASVGDTSLATATATTSAARGSYSLEVLQIAQGQRLITNETVAPSVSDGTLTFRFGRYEVDNSDPNNPVTSFTQSSSASVTLEPGKTTLQDLRDAINSANVGVRAQVINNGETDQLIIAGNNEGRDSAFQIVGAGGLSAFSYDASTGATSTLNEIETAQDAQIRLDGVTLTRASNTITDAVDGVTLNLLKGEPDKQTTLTIANDRTAVRAAIDNLVKAYNEFNIAARQLGSYNEETRQAGPLNGDSALRSIQQQLRNTIGGIFTNPDGVQSLSAIGVSFNRDGSLSVDTGTLDRALNDPDMNVAGLFTGADGKSGFAFALSGVLDGILGTGGTLDSRSDGINRSIRSLDEQRERLGMRLEMIEKRYRAQFTALDSMLGSMQQTSNYLQQQLSSLSRMSSGNN
ncbi:MAG TPA: flagellar filament capping protein FliD [Azoarcus taiwanensis]|nr:flagellar filament capping protein FliD [Azoarcus taiwanensis]